MKADLKELRTKAEAAKLSMEDQNKSNWTEKGEARAELHHAIAPQAVLALIDRIEKAEGLIKSIPEQRSIWGGNLDAIKLAREYFAELGDKGET